MTTFGSVSLQCNADSSKGPSWHLNSCLNITCKMFFTEDNHLVSKAIKFSAESRLKKFYCPTATICIYVENSLMEVTGVQMFLSSERFFHKHQQFPMWKSRSDSIVSSYGDTL